MLIYKIFRADEWRALRAEKVSQGAPVDLADGYIHFSTAEQAPETAAKHFAGQDDLMLVAVEVDVWARRSNGKCRAAGRSFRISIATCGWRMWHGRSPCR